MRCSIPDTGTRKTIAKKMVAKLTEASGGKQVLSVHDCVILIGYFIDSAVEELLEQQRIEMRHLGVFSLKKQKARYVRNPKTRETFLKPEHYKLIIKPSSTLVKKVKKLKPK